jgi:hypothetical protein
MKKQIVLLALAAAVMLFFSCNKNKGGETDNSPSPPRVYESSRPVVESYSFNPGHSLRVNAGFYKIKDNIDTGDESTVVVWASNLALGENVMVGRPRKLTYVDDKNKKSVWDLIEVQLNDKNKTKGFAFENQIAINGSLAVVTDEKAILYSAANATKPTNTVVTRKTVVVYYLDAESSGFVEVKGWDCDTTKKYRLIADNRYMRLSSISKDDADIQAAILLQTALTMTREDQALARETLLKTAKEEYPYSKFIEEINNALNNEGFF